MPTGRTRRWWPPARQPRSTARKRLGSKGAAMKCLTTLAMVLAAASALSASAQIAPLDRAKEAAAQSTAASRGTAEQQHAVNMQDSKPAPPPSQAITGTAVSPAKAAPAAKKGK